jgi:crotonobetainyl-CoA:carnitine CoA-transferase CaiB-like acyl-CoA transferase
MSAACDGLRVIDFSTWMAGPLATMVLADNGAEVIKIEPPEGDPARALPAFQTWNRGKQSVALDLKTDAGRERALGLVRDADVVVTSFRPGVAGRLGVGYEQARAANPRAVYAEITGYGEQGANARLRGYEALVSAKSGRMAAFERIADRDGPMYPAVPCASFAAAMFTVQGILAALHKRRETGLGQKVSVSLLASLLPYDMVQWIRPQISGVDAQTASRAGEKGVYNQPGASMRQTAAAVAAASPANEMSRSYNPQQIHRPGFRVPRPNYMTAVTKDGVWLQLANTADHLWLAQMQAMGLVELYGEDRFAKMPSVGTEADSEALWELILERVRMRTYDEWREIFDQHEDVAVDRLLQPFESLEHRQVQHNGHVVQVEGLDGQVTLQPGSLVRFSESEVRIGPRAPRVGEHNAQFADERSAAGPAPAPSSNIEPRGPLDGVTILDFATFFASPYATSILANLGARVIKIETLGGDYSRYSAGGLLAFPTTQGKQSIALDLKHPDGRAIAHKLIERADMLLHNFRPGVPERLQIDYETCRKLNPRLVYLYGASYGDGGPDASRPAFHPIAGAIAGNAMRQAGAGHPPNGSETLEIEDLKLEAWRMLRANEANPDVNAAIAAATALMLGLAARDASGHGQSLMTTMIASNLYANSDELIAYEGRPPVRQADAQLLGISPLYRLYETADGWVFLACLRRKEWETFCRAVEREDLISTWDAAWAPGCSSTGEPAAGIAELLRSKSATEWERTMMEHDVPLVAVEQRDPGRVCLEDADMRAQGYVVPVESAVYGQYWRHGSPVQFSGHELSYGPWEAVGGHTREVLAELGYSVAQIDRLIADKVVEAEGDGA